MSGLRSGVDAVEVVAGFLPDGGSTDGDQGVLPAAKSGLGCEAWDGRDWEVVWSDRLG